MRKPVIVIFILLLLEAVSGCTSPVRRQLDRAEAVMESAPDSALAILDSIDTATLTRASDRALYALLLTQGREKNYAYNDSGLLIQEAVTFYSKNGDEYRKMLSLYYLGNPTSWKGVSWTLPIPSTGTRYVRGLTIDSKAMRPLPESIGELYFLKRLEVIGNVTGELPESMCQHGNVDTLIVSNTDMPGLGKDAFHSNMKYVSVRGNYKMGTLPASVTTLKGITEPASFNLSGNGFYGYIPAFEGVNIDLSNNQFSMVDFANAFNATQSTKESGKKEVYGVHMAGNNFSHLVIPENVLSDTLALIHLAVLNQPIDYSKTFSNMPSQAELKALAEKYYRNHPDLADLSSLFD